MPETDKKPEKIILTGYRATGKSSVGKMVAELTGYEFIDMDKVLEGRFGKISDLVAEKGWDFFRAREKELLVELTGTTGKVIATGGGAILHQEVWDRFKASGWVVWLTSDLESICSRLAVDPASPGQRPSLTGADIREEAAAVLAAREPLYREGSHLEVDSNRPLDQVVAEIMAALQSRF
ncbi:MAG: shikimate kinase [Proteobacteria bacterium]|nr:shikimate kinase [Pseudomonadota bacterium]MBU1738275.1 shikimate kinase [Pseudomonadota bacterium]